jgi:DNA primase
MKIQPETIARIKQVIDPEAVLNYLGFHILRRTSKELRGPCKVHGGDNPTGFRFNLETKTWCCYTRHCEGESDRDLVGLVQRVTGQPFLESVRLLADISGVNLDKQDQVSEEYLRLKQKQAMDKEIRQVRNRNVEVNPYPEEVVQEMMLKRSDYFIKRGFPEGLLDFFQVGGMIDSRGVPRETIPIRSPNGNVLTVSARRTDSDEDPTYLLLKSIPKGTTLYNLDIAKRFVGLPRTLILVEGFVDVWTLALHGVWNAVAVMGTDITPRQAQLISIYADEVILMLDPDDAGQQGMERVEKLLSFYVQVKPLRLPPGKDPKYFTYTDVKHYFGGMIQDD